MTKQDAAKILSLTGPLTPAIIKKAYKRASMKYHPDRNPAGLEMMKAVNEAYSTLKYFEGGDIEPNTSEQDYPQELNDALNAIVSLDGLEIEICGSWVWVGGNTKTHKDIIKNAGFKWAKKKAVWFFRPNDYKSKGRGKFSMNDIRERHGSSSVNSVKRNKLRAA